ncbi:hypothetical protein PVAND_003712 [Polypedilum vanderplanki]|uniref:Tyrosine-protein kinase n=1 Tax=Polypedilum vanderplanki TaxID=319348 RepID=A0A9J6BVF1_POLVA|nr:hypothetical protein PVAND_003712 [Polypedilum vanderplanki]
MGLSTQGKNIHDVITARHESEIRLIEVMRKCLLLKVKCDRDYASSIQSVSVVGLKIDRIDDLNGSQIFKTWKRFMEELENQSKLIRKKMECLENICIDRISNILVEKRKIKKQCQDDHEKIASRLFQFTDEVAKKKTEYNKQLEYYKQMRLRFEEHYIKSGRAGRKLDDVREKYQKACRKLHLIHNEYVLLLHEATEVEKDYRTDLFPTFLSNQEALHEQFNENWNSILVDIAKLLDLSSADEFLKTQEQLSNGLKGSISKDEYNDILEKYKASPIVFHFDENLINDNVGKLLPNQLAVDNLTIDWLKQKMLELEQSMKECQEEQQKLKQSNSSEQLTLNNLLNKSLVNIEGQNHSSQIVDLKLKSLKNEERQMFKVLEIIKSSLNEVSLNELPSGCDDDLPSVVVENDEKYRNSTLTVSPTQPLYLEPWFHGVLPREEVVRLLRNEGDFLVRETTRNDETQIVLSVCWNGHKHFIVQTTADNHYRFEGPSFANIQELILHQYQSGLVVTNRSGAILKNAIFREKWELSNDDVLLVEKIGRGNFGDVYKAKLKNTKQEVAVKTCKMTLPEEQKKKFLQEGRILKQYDHPNIVKLIGICVQKQPIMIVMELVEGGSLLMFLRKNAQILELKQMLRMCSDISAGMQYLESKNCIHRDLAARNCLIGSENIVKISDFGMSREEEEYIVSDGMKQIPIKWTAPEALNWGKYNSLTDVWSYGILMFEIFSKGATPYSGMSNSKAREKIEEGYRLPAPEGTPIKVYELMLKCWSIEPIDRPHFNEIHNEITHLLNQ